MNNYCTQCGNPLNGKHQCEKCGNINRGTFNIISDKVKGYDYKGKAAELKAKANETIDKAKSYDYRSETENIKKGGIKYFWNMHRKLSICIMCFLAVVCVFLCVNKANENADTPYKISTYENESVNQGGYQKYLEKMIDYMMWDYQKSKT